MLKMLVRLMLLALAVIVFSYLWQCLPSWAPESPYDYSPIKENFTLLEQVHSQVEKETTAAVNPYLTNRIQS